MKYYVIQTTKDGILYKQNKCRDGWTKDKTRCWRFSYAGAKRISDRLNAGLSEFWRCRIHYNILLVEI